MQLCRPQQRISKSVAISRHLPQMHQWGLAAAGWSGSGDGGGDGGGSGGGGLWRYSFQGIKRDPWVMLQDCQHQLLQC